MERCLNPGCGWEGTEADKAHWGISALKGPGVCPDCGGDEFEAES